MTATNPIPHADGEGWLCHYFECFICGHKQAHVAPIPTASVACSRCGADHYIEIGEEDE